MTLGLLCLQQLVGDCQDGSQLRGIHGVSVSYRIRKGDLSWLDIAVKCHPALCMWLSRCYRQERVQ
jgi:hypothetical protein